MSWFQGWAVPTALAILVASVSGCGGRASAPDSASNGGSSGNAAAGADGGAAQSGAAAVVEACPVQPPSRQEMGTIITFQTRPFLAGQPMVFGEPNALPGGGTLTPLNFRFYISDVRLVDADGGLTPTDLVTPAGMLEPYGVHLFNAEDTASTAWRIRARAGNYSGLQFALGLADGCNAGDPSQRTGALAIDSQMTWVRGFGYLFLLFEARIEGAAGGGGGASGGNPSDPVAVIRMGGLPGLIFAPTVHLNGPLAVPETGALTRSVRLEMGQLFTGANSTEPFTDPGPANPPLGGLGEGAELRHAAPGLPMFVLEP
jgi:hypothetical protein